MFRNCDSIKKSYKDDSYNKFPFENGAYGTSAQDGQHYGEQSHDNFAYNNQLYDNQSYDNQSYDNQSYDNQSYDNQSYDNQSYGNQSYDNQSYDNQSYDNQSYGNQSYGNQSYDNQSYDNQLYGNQSYDNQSYGNQSYDNQSYDNQSYDNQSYDTQSYDDESYNNGSYGTHGYAVPSYHSSPDDQPPGRSPKLKILFVVLIIVFIVSATTLIRYLVDTQRSKNTSNDLRNAYQAIVTAPPATQDPLESEVELQATTEDITQPIIQPTAQPEYTGDNSSVDQTSSDIGNTQEAYITDVGYTSTARTHYPGNPNWDVDPKINELQNTKNKDIVGWIEIPNLINEAVVQRDNSHYLDHDALGNKNPSGALFLDESCQLRYIPDNLVIHGHNMKNGVMFGSLKKYKVKDSSFYHANPYIHLNTLYEDAKYVIFAVFECDIRPDQNRYFNFMTTDFYEDQFAVDYVNRAKELSLFTGGVDFNPDDRLITLATCSGEDDYKRLVVVGRKVREGEDLNQLGLSIYSSVSR